MSSLSTKCNPIFKIAPENALLPLMRIQSCRRPSPDRQTETPELLPRRQNSFKPDDFAILLPFSMARDFFGLA